MTHDELLAQINEYIQDCENYVRMEGEEGYKALRAVVELHKPDKFGDCVGCDNPLSPTNWCYPCPTIQAIEKELA